MCISCILLSLGFLGLNLSLSMTQTAIVAIVSLVLSLPVFLALLKLVKVTCKNGSCKL